MRAGDRSEKRGLAGAVRADQRDRLAGLDGERDAAHRLELAVTRFEPIDREQRQTTPPPR